MSQARGAQEPTMEEILSSIRRIISEDGKRGPDGAPEVPPAAAPAAEPAPAPPVTLRAMPPAAEPAADDDVLELTEVALEEPADPEPLELMEEVATPTLPEPAPAPMPASAPPPAALEPVPEPTPIPAAAPIPPATPVPPPQRAALAPVPEPELDPEPQSDSEPQPGSLPQPEPQAEPQPEPAPEPESEAQIEIQAEPEPEPEPDVQNNLEPLEISVASQAPTSRPQPSTTGGSRLMSEATEIASSAALSFLAQVVQPGRGFTEEGRRMVDQIMRNQLEAHLRDWMDANLPTLVERIVREEITGLVERSLGRRG